MKQAKHVQPSGGSQLRIRVCDLGGFLVATRGCDDAFDHRMGEDAAFTDADQCAEWVRSFLRNATKEKFGAKKSARISD